MRIDAPLALVAMTLAACSPAPAEHDPAQDIAAATPVANAPTSARTTPRDSGEIAVPAAFIGVWDYVEGSCDPSSDLRLEIAPTRFVFYESVGEVEALDGDADEITVTLAMSGEGETWTNTQTFRLREDGRILETEQSAPDGERTLRRRMCA